MNIREIQPNEYPLLDNFLYDAIFIPEGIAPPPIDIIQLPELQHYILNFGTQKDDFEQTPSLSISVKKEYRKKGIGTTLMKQMLFYLQQKGYHQVSLSVQKANYACKMYLKLGFEIVKINQEDYIMVYHFSIKTPHLNKFLRPKM